MTVWRPQPSIQVKALGLVWRRGQLLASEICEDDGRIKGVRPLGGRLEFGETWHAALIREFREELDVTVKVVGAPFILENIYEHHGALGHEIVFLADVLFPEGAYQDAESITYQEDTGETCRARWFDVDMLEGSGLALYPSGLKAKLKERSAGAST